MADFHPRADKVRRNRVNDAADRFESSLLGDMIRDRLLYGDGPLVQLASAMEECYSLEEHDVPLTDEMQSACFSAAQEIYEALDTELERQVLQALGDIVDDADEIIDHHEEDGQAAVAEARHYVAIAGLPAEDDVETEEAVA